MGDLGLNQMAQLELLDLIHEICEEEQIPYTLLNASIAAWKEYKGFAPFLRYMAVGMPYPSFIKFIRTCEKRLSGTEYYITGNQTCEQFEELWVWFCKRSKVILPDRRKKDEVYYDYFVAVVPIYYVGNQKKELVDVKRKYKRYQKCVSAQKILPGMVHLDNCFRMAKRAYYYSQKKKNSFEDIKNSVTKYGEQCTKYVFIPSLYKQRGVSCLAETYLHLQKVEFEKHTYYMVQNADEWLKDFYGVRKYKNLINLPFNKVNVTGPEILRRVQLIELEMLREFDRICRKHHLKYILGFGTLLGAVRHGGFIPWDDDIDVCMLYEDYMKFLNIAPAELDSEKFFLRTQETDQDCNLTFAQLKRNHTVYCRNMRNHYNTHLGVFLDIFPFFNGSNSRILHNIQFKVCKFYKTMVWAHMGAAGEQQKIKKRYYTWLSRSSNKKAYEKYIRWATLFKKSTDKLAYLSLSRNPYNMAYTRKESFEKITEMEFEGYRFYVPENYEEVLDSIYPDYRNYPSLSGRVVRHLPANIEIGDLFENLDTE